jgi:archaeal flagellar protein FlaH
VLDTLLKQDNLLPSGIGEIDKKLAGGLPTSSLTLIEGESDAGKTSIVQQFLYGALTAGKRVALYTTENTIQSLLKQMKLLNVDVDDYFIVGRLSVYPLPAVSDATGSRTNYSLLLDHIKEQDADVVFIDGVTGLVSHAEEASTLDFFFAARDLCISGKSLVLTLHSYACREGLLLRLLSLCDAHLHLRVEDVGQRLCKTLEIAKIRGASRSGGAYSVCFEVVPDMGIMIIPVFKAKL